MDDSIVLKKYVDKISTDAVAVEAYKAKRQNKVNFYEWYTIR